MHKLAVNLPILRESRLKTHKVPLLVREIRLESRACPVAGRKRVRARSSPRIPRAFQLSLNELGAVQIRYAGGERRLKGCGRSSSSSSRVPRVSVRLPPCCSDLAPVFLSLSRLVVSRRRSAPVLSFPAHNTPAGSASSGANEGRADTAGTPLLSKLQNEVSTL